MIEFWAGWDAEKFDLEAGIARAGLVATGPPRYARFDPFFTPWFLRRNEVVQDVVWQGES